MKNERRIQQDIVMYYRNSYCLAHHTPRCLVLSIPNEGNPRLAQTGALSGASDLLVIHRMPNTTNRVIFVEVKAGGRQSEKQRIFENHVKSMGMEYVIVRSLDEFKNVIENGVL